VNPSHEFLASPSLDVVLSSEGATHGRKAIGSSVEAAPPGGSAFYQATGLYGGSLRVGDWDEHHFLLRGNDSIEPDLNVYESIGIEGDRIYNNGVTPVGAITFIEVSHGSDGMFVALCSSDGALDALSGDGTGWSDNSSR
jgi:hypothetical protein